MLPTGTARLCIAGRRFFERQDFAAIQKPFWITRMFTVSPVKLLSDCPNSADPSHCATVLGLG